MNSSGAEIVNLFGCPAAPGATFAAEVYPGYPGLVAAGDNVHAMSWGSPLVLKSKVTGAPLKPKSMNNAREDKRGTAFWRDGVASSRSPLGPRQKESRAA